MCQAFNIMQDNTEMQNHGHFRWLYKIVFLKKVLCQEKNIKPLSAIQAYLSKGCLRFCVDRVGLKDWSPILKSIAQNRNLMKIDIYSRSQCKRVREKVNTEEKLEKLCLQVASLGRKWKGKEKEGEREIEMMRSDLEEYIERKGLHELKEETGGWNDNERKGPNVPNNRLSHLTEKIKKEKQKECKNPRPAFDVTSRRCKAKNQVRPIIYTNFLLRCLIDSIAVCLRDSPAITSITIDGIPLTLKYLNILCSGLKTNEKLISLSLKKCYIGDIGCDLLLNCLKNNPKLSVLNLSSCKLSSRSAMSISLFLKRRKADLLQNIWEQSSEEDTEKLQGLQTLILNQNPKIEDTGLKQIIYALKNDAWLKTLSLKRCGISKLGAEMIIQLLQSNNKIMRLDLTKNHIPINTLQIMLGILKKRQEIAEKTLLNKQFCLNWRKNINNEIIKFTKRHRKHSQNRTERPRKSSLQKHYWKKTQRFERFIREKEVKGITKEDYYRRKKINDLELQLLNLIESNSKLKEELSSNKALLNSEVQQRSKIENELQRISFRLNDLKSKVFMLNCISSKACNESQLLTGFKYIFEKLESFSMLKQNVSVNEEVDLETVEPLWSSPLAEQMENCVLNCSQRKPYFISH